MFAKSKEEKKVTARLQFLNTCAGLTLPSDAASLIFPGFDTPILDAHAPQGLLREYFEQRAWLLKNSLAMDLSAIENSVTPQDLMASMRETWTSKLVRLPASPFALQATLYLLSQKPDFFAPAEKTGLVIPYPSDQLIDGERVVIVFVWKKKGGVYRWVIDYLPVKHQLLPGTCVVDLYTRRIM